MSLARPHRPRGGHFRGDGRLSYGRNGSMGKRATGAATNYNWNYDGGPYNANFFIENHVSSCGFSQKSMLDGFNYDPGWHDVMPSSKRRKASDLTRQSTGRPYQQRLTYANGLENIADPWQHVPPQFFNAYSNPSVVYNNSSVVAATRSDNVSGYASTTSKRDRSKFEDDEEAVFMSRDEIEMCSPSRKDGIDLLQETHLRYSYCAFLQNLGVRLDLPQTTIGSAMVLCHRFFIRRSHASHDRFLIATAALFLASKSEEAPRPLNDVLKVSCEVFHKQDFTVLSYMLPFVSIFSLLCDAAVLISCSIFFFLSLISFLPFLF
ncbi:hypothetical protein CDL12_27925 [Handroanthus impetiginosus]|uniref:Cyclin-like domain-containing protein n=1 Tax=Handroanthus impetiginosus TaxID=429701 RepID=A0A2G9G2M2_9LAMI|nr:hypothetical protein CDL12_27925 [Handroanthus impetiginosus]